VPDLTLSTRNLGSESSITPVTIHGTMGNTRCTNQVFKDVKTVSLITEFLRYDRPVAPFAFLTNHGLALLCIAEDPRIRMREIAATVEITERSAQRIVSDLIEAGYVERARDGRRNTYTVRRDLPISLPSKRDVDLNSLLTVLLPAVSTDERRGEIVASVH